ITACRPRTSPASAIRTISVLPSREVVESLARPWQRIKIPQGFCPSTRTAACSGKTAGCLIRLKASMDAGERLQKKLRLRRWQSRQLSTQFKPDIIGAPHSLAETRLRRRGANDSATSMFESSTDQTTPCGGLTSKHCTPAATFGTAILGRNTNTCSVRRAGDSHDLTEGWQRCRQLGGLARPGPVRRKTNREEPLGTRINPISPPSTARLA